MLQKKIEYIDLGLQAYLTTWKFQEKQLQSLLKLREDQKKQDFAGWFYVVEHPHVYTLGKNGKLSNLLLSSYELQKKGIEFVQTNRGGDITYHGPGQVVGYPILDLKKLSIGAKMYVFILEETIIRVLSHFGIKSERLHGATGVWLDTSQPTKARKICAIGIRISHGITMHGFAFNVNTDLNYFSFIHPCGLANMGVTSLQKELQAPQDMTQIKLMIFKEFKNILDNIADIFPQI
ncbi:MAG: lipoyl(octanoyl) transferase LipB [Bacteroidales bacterium]|nr:lipoyl(octanoyl) transferase LipB [Bacteroidales bacterium]